MRHTQRPVLHSISPDATPEEVAAIAAAIAAVTARGPAPIGAGDGIHEWVRTSRLRAHRAGLRRGPWRLSGRMPRRARA